MGACALCGEDRRLMRDELRQFPEILGGGGQQELIFGSLWATEAQSTEPEDALQMSEEHLDLLSFSTRDGVGLGLGDRTGLVTSGFMNRGREMPREAFKVSSGPCKTCPTSLRAIAADMQAKGHQISHVGVQGALKAARSAS